MKLRTLFCSPPMPETSRSSQVTPTCLCLIPAAEFASFDDVRYSRRSKVSWRSPSRPFSRSAESEPWDTTLLGAFGVPSDRCTRSNSFSAWATTTWSWMLRSCQSVEAFDVGVSVATGGGGRGDRWESGLCCFVHPARGIEVRGRHLTRRTRCVTRTYSAGQASEGRCDRCAVDVIRVGTRNPLGPG